MSKQPRISLASIVAAAAPAHKRPTAEVVQFCPSEAPPSTSGRGTLKERAKQLSVYLEPPVHDQLREIAYTERTKIHQLMLEAVDLLFKNRGALSSAQLTETR